MHQTALAAVGLYAALSTLILFWLTTATGLIRRRHKVRHFIKAGAPQWRRAAGFGLGGLAMLAAVLGLLGHALRLLF